MKGIANIDINITSTSKCNLKSKINTHRNRNRKHKHDRTVRHVQLVATPAGRGCEPWLIALWLVRTWPLDLSVQEPAGLQPLSADEQPARLDATVVGTCASPDSVGYALDAVAALPDVDVVNKGNAWMYEVDASGLNTMWFLWFGQPGGDFLVVDATGKRVYNEGLSYNQCGKQSLGWICPQQNFEISTRGERSSKLSAKTTSI